MRFIYLIQGMIQKYCSGDWPGRRYPRRMILLGVYLGINLMVLQAQPPVKSFEALSRENHVLLRWIISAGFTCQGIRIQHSTDSEFFQTIGEIPGICGSPENDMVYYYSDSTAQPFRWNYYRLELGSLGYSKVVSVYFVNLGLDEYRIVVDGLSGGVGIYFSNPEQLPAQCTVFNAAGQILQTIATTEEVIYLHDRWFGPSVLIVWLSLPDRTIRLKVPLHR